MSRQPKSAAVPTFITALLTAAAISTTIPTGTGTPTMTVHAGDTTTTRAPPTTTTTRAPTTTTTAPTTTETSSPPTSNTTTTPPPTTTTAGPVTPDPAAAAVISAATTELRAELALPALQPDITLQTYATAQAETMAATGELSHGPIEGLIDGFVAVGENLGVGPEPAAVFDALTDSAAHLAVLTDPTYDHGATGAARDAEGNLWVCQVFAADAEATTAPTLTVPTLPDPPAVTLP
jgi:uncharacterized protein YkwD